MALTRKFNGKTYYFDSQFRTWNEANHQAKELRKAGNAARVTEYRERYVVWVRSPEDYS